MATTILLQCWQNQALRMEPIYGIHSIKALTIMSGTADRKELFDLSKKDGTLMGIRPFLYVF